VVASVEADAGSLPKGGDPSRYQIEAPGRWRTDGRRGSSNRWRGWRPWSD